MKGILYFVARLFLIGSDGVFEQQVILVFFNIHFSMNIELLVDSSVRVRGALRWFDSATSMSGKRRMSAFRQSSSLES